MATKIKFGYGAESMQTTTGTLTNSAFRGLRIMAPINNFFQQGPHFLCSRGYDENAGSIPDFTSNSYLTNFGRYNMGTGASPTYGAVDFFMVVGVDELHGHPGGGDNPVIFGAFKKANFFNLVSRLPYFTPVANGGFGNVMVSTTDVDAVVLQMYQAGMWILLNGMIPPINVDCILNYSMDYSDSWDGGTDVYDWQASAPGTGNDATITGPNPGVGAFGGNGSQSYLGVLETGGNCYLSQNSSISLQGAKVTYEWIAKLDQLANPRQQGVIFDATSGGGALCQANVNGREFDWGGFGIGNIPSGQINGIPEYNHWAMVTGNSISGVAKFYYQSGNTGFNSWGAFATGTATTAMTTLTTGLTIGADNSGSNIWGQHIGAFRIWDGELTTTQAEICARHEKGRAGILNF